MAIKPQQNSICKDCYNLYRWYSVHLVKNFSFVYVFWVFISRQNFWKLLRRWSCPGNSFLESSRQLVIFYTQHFHVKFSDFVYVFLRFHFPPKISKALIYIYRQHSSLSSFTHNILWKISSFVYVLWVFTFHFVYVFY